MARSERNGNPPAILPPPPVPPREIENLACIARRPPLVIRPSSFPTLPPHRRLQYASA